MELFTYILKSAGVLLLFYAVYFFWLQKDTLFKAKRQFLLFGLITAIFLPFVELTKAITVEIPEMAPLVSSGVTSISQLPTEAEGFPLSGWDVLWVVYIIGILFMSFRFLKEMYALVQVFLSWKAEKIDGSFHIKTTHIRAPFSFFNYIVYNPSIHTKEELQMILKHEKVHANQWHSADIILANLLLIMQWINPIAWLFKNCIEENLEFIADNETVQQIPSKKAYQLALVKASSPHMAPALTNNFYQSFIKKRIIMLNKSNSRKINVLKIGIILPLLALFLWSFNVKEIITYKTIPAVKKQTEKPSIITNPIIENSEEKANLERAKIADLNEVKPTKVEIQPTKEEINIRGKFSVKITKNTSNAEFEKIKKELKEKYGIDLSYTVVRNDANEIISLSMNYSSTDSRNGNYQVNDDDGIEEFHFYIDEEGKSGFWSEATEERRVERMERRTKEMEERKEEMEIRREKVKEEIKERRKDLDKRREKIEKRRVTQVAVVNDSDDNNSTYTIATGSGSNKNVAVVSSSINSVVINKNTSNVELSKMKKKLAAQNIKFTYKNVKRNKAGEITGLKIIMDDNKGSKTSTSIKSDDGEAIDQIIIQQ